MTQLPDPIPVYVGDDWSFAFTLREGGGNAAPVDLTACTVDGLLFPAYQPSPIALQPGLGFAGLIGSGAEGKLGLGITRDQTAGFVPSSIGGRLQVRVLRAGRLHTHGVFPLLVLALGEITPGLIVNRTVTDPVSGRVLTFDGAADGYPIVGDLTTNFDTNDNPAVPLLG